MCCEHLVCASCANPVAEGRCPTCRTARAEMHGSSTPAYSYVVAAVLLFAALVLLLGHTLGG
jgi:hypothetical protein